VKIRCCLSERHNRGILQLAPALPLVLLAVLFTVSFTQAGESTSALHDTDLPPLVDRVWILCPENDCSKNSSAQTQIDAVFDDSGQLTGYSGCNRFKGSYDVEGNTMRIGFIMLTRMGCEAEIMKQEYAFVLALQDTASYHIHVNTLELYAAEGSLLATFEAENVTLRIFVPYISVQTY
jgi:heat shock protein HslJ